MPRKRKTLSDNVEVGGNTFPTVAPQTRPAKRRRLGAMWQDEGPSLSDSSGPPCGSCEASGEMVLPARATLAQGRNLLDPSSMHAILASMQNDHDTEAAVLLGAFLKASNTSKQPSSVVEQSFWSKEESTGKNMAKTALSLQSQSGCQSSFKTPPGSRVDEAEKIATEIEAADESSKSWQNKTNACPE